LASLFSRLGLSTDPGGDGGVESATYGAFFVGMSLAGIFIYRRKKDLE
jgi:hypothetical protein